MAERLKAIVLKTPLDPGFRRGDGLTIFLSG